MSLGSWRIGLCGYTDLLLIEDLGNCIQVRERVVALLREERESELDELEQDLIQLTARILTCGIVDPDHSLENTVLDSHGRMVRLDFDAMRVQGSPGEYMQIGTILTN